MNQDDPLETQRFQSTSGVGNDEAKEEPARPRYDQPYLGRGHYRGESSDIPTSSLESHPRPQDAVDQGRTISSLTAAESMRSYDSARDLTSFFREINGRRFSSQPSTYMLPSGERPSAMFASIR